MPPQLTVWMQEWTPALQVNLVHELEEKLSVDIKIETYRWDWGSFHPKLLRSLKEGSAPDIIEIGTTWTGLLAHENVLLDITGFATRDLRASSTFFSRFLSSCRTSIYSKRYYGIPMLADVRVLFYNNDILGAYLQNHPHAFDSWQSFEAMCLSLKNIMPNRVIAWPWERLDAFHDCLPWVWAAGGDFISQSGEVLIDSTDTQQAFQRLVHLILTDCAASPPDPLVRGNNDIRSHFIAGQVGIMTGAFWMIHQIGQFRNVKAALHPPDLYPTTFAGGSNLAVVKKHGDDEQDAQYTSAKAFIEQLTSAQNQVILAPSIGKLPCNISAWKTLKEQADNEDTRAIFETFDDALCYTVERSLPNIPNLVQIEEELKTGVSHLWLRIGKIKRDSPAKSLQALENECTEVIHEELSQLRQQIEKYLTGHIFRLTSQNVREMGLTPPGWADLWVEATSKNPVDGKVYVKDRGLIEKGMGQQRFEILFSLLNASNCTLTEGELLRQLWGYQMRTTNLTALSASAQKISQLTKLLEETIGATPDTVESLWSHLVKLDTSIADVSRRGCTVEHLQRQICQAIYTNSEMLHFDQEDYYLARDRLRQAFNGINNALGEIKGELVLQRVNEPSYSLALNASLSICLVTR